MRDDQLKKAITDSVEVYCTAVFNFLLIAFAGLMLSPFIFGVLSLFGAVKITADDVVSFSAFALVINMFSGMILAIIGPDQITKNKVLSIVLTILGLGLVGGFLALNFMEIIRLIMLETCILTIVNIAFICLNIFCIANR